MFNNSLDTLFSKYFSTYIKHIFLDKTLLNLNFQDVELKISSSVVISQL